MLKPKRNFIVHLSRNFLFGLLFIAIALGLGMAGYHYTEKLSWIDSFVNAAMILSGMGPVSELHTWNGKFFAGCYALFSGLAFIAIIVIIFSPIAHRFFKSLNIYDKS